MNIPKLPEKPNFRGEKGNYFCLDEDHRLWCEWYSSLKEWHRKVFEGAQEVFNHDSGLCARDWRSKHDAPSPSHKAILLKPQPIREESAEDILKEFVNARNRHGSFLDDIYLKAREFLARKEREK